MKIHILNSEYWDSSLLKITDLRELVEKYSSEAASILGDNWENFNIIVKPNLSHVSSTKGVGGSTYDHEMVDITFNHSLTFGIKLFKKYLREAIFHEMNHALYMKYNPRENRQIYWTIMEGLGVVFDSEYSDGEHFLNGEAEESEMLEWAKKYSDNTVYHWEVPNDGMMYQVGAWIVKKAAEKSNKNVIELTVMSCDEILQLSQSPF